MLNGIAIIGLETGRTAHLSPDILEILESAQEIYVKQFDTQIVAQTGASVKYLSPHINPLNALTDGYRRFANRLVESAPAVYLLPGDPLIDEAATPIIQEAAAQAYMPLQIIPAPSRLPLALQTLQLSPGSGLQILDADILCSHYYPPLEPHRPALITGLYHPELIALLKSKLGAIYPMEAQVKILTPAGPRETKLKNLSDDASFLYLPPQAESAGLTALQEIIAHLRAPDGCPWDREQTHQSLRAYLLEETYEALAAVDSGNLTELSYELGDVLLQIVLHAQIAVEAGAFQMNDIIHKINQKMLRRHPHVFADVQVNNSDEVVANWAAIKAREKAKKGEAAEAYSALDGISAALPALAQAMDISRRAVAVGFEWNSVDGVLDKLVEEAHELAASNTPTDIESELGDFLFVAVNLARKLNVDPESALRGSNARFTQRFKQMERFAGARNLNLADLDSAAWQSLWREAKGTALDQL